MAKLIRKQTTHYHDANGKRVPAGTPNATRVVVVSAKWYGTGVPGWPKGKAVPLSTERRTAEKMLAELVRKAELGAVGLRATPAHGTELEPLLQEFESVLQRESKPNYVTEAIRNVRRVLNGCRLRTVADLLAPDLASRVEAFVWKLDVAPRTAHGIGSHARQFTRWLWRKKRELDHDVLAGMDLPTSAPKRKRRDFTADELHKLLSQPPIGGTQSSLTHADRIAIYTLAATTGLRAKEIASLHVSNFRIETDTPTVFIDGRHTKNGKDATLPLPLSTVDVLRPILEQRKEGVVWPGRWFRKAATMIWRDMKHAGILISTNEGRADFHSLRHSFITMLGKGSGSAKTIQTLARHSTPILTVGRYSHSDLSEQHAAVSGLPVNGSEAIPPKDIVLAVCVSLFAVLFAPSLQSTRDNQRQPGETDKQTDSTSKARKRKKS